jgi:1-acyl-sn-glycerol-3-phosphate acyltransferase
MALISPKPWPRRTVLYRDPLRDDFDPTNGKIRARRIGADYDYDRGFFWRAGGDAVYYALAAPLLLLVCRVCWGLRVRNRRALRGLRSGFYLYANHTNALIDAYMPLLVCFPRRARVVTADEAVSVPGLGDFVHQLGAIPLPNTVGGTRKFLAALDRWTARGEAVAIYPEAHIWPYASLIRPFPDGSFAYPVRDGLPAVPVTVVYRRRRLLPNLPPLATAVVGSPERPDPSLPPRLARRDLRDRVLARMRETAARENRCEYIRYRPEQEEAHAEK